MAQIAHDSVAQSKWVWKASGMKPAQGSGKPMSIQLKAIIQFAVMSLVIGFMRWKFPGHLVGPILVGTIAVLVLVGGLFVPPLFHAIERFGQKLGKWVAAGLTWGLLVPFFYICFTFGRLVLLVLGRDPMDRKVPTDKPTYWEPREPVPSLDQYRRQH